MPRSALVPRSVRSWHDACVPADPDFHVSGATGHDSLDFLVDAGGVSNVSVNLGDRIASLAGLRHLPPSLKNLALSAIWVRRPSLLPVARFSDLTDLYLGGPGALNDMDALSSLRALEVVRLYQRPSLDLLPLTHASRLWHLEVAHGTLADGTASLAQLTALRFLELAYLRGVKELPPLSDLRNLERLDLASMSSLERLPDLSRATRLRTVMIENCRAVKDLAPLAQAPALEQVLLVNMPHLRPSDVAPLIGHPTMREFSVGTGSERRNGEIRQILGLPEVERILFYAL